MTTRVPTIFTRIAKGTARLTGRPLTFSIAVFLVIAWAVSGPYFQYSDTWQLTINTGTTIVTFLMVFLIQATQNRDAEAIQIKLDEVIRSLQGAHNALLDLEELEEEDLMKMRENYLALAEQARRRLKRGKDDTGVPEINHDHAKVAKQVPAGQRRAR
ncbi:MAG TPA: low affinity iron permease family protein [Usitatibacter sp.]|nr:low affinity iron permease family protein [Usitatibacter sp.]